MTSPPPHLAISGDLGSGKSSVAAGLAEALGFEVVSTGAIQRGIAAEMGLSVLEASLLAEVDPMIDDRIDGTTVRLAREAVEPIIFDSRMAWHFAPGAFRVRLTVDPAVAAHRIMGRGPGATEQYASLAEAAERIRERAESEARRYQTKYGVDHTDPANFDLVIDTTAVPLEACITQILTAYSAAPLPRAEYGES